MMQSPFPDFVQAAQPAFIIGVVSGTILIVLIGLGLLSWRIARSLQRLHKEDLRKSEERFRTIVNGINDALFIHDKDTGEILDINDRTYEMYGYTREEIRNLQISDLSAGYRPYDQPTALIRIQQALTGIPQVFEWYAKDKQNQLFWVEVNMRLARIEGVDRILVAVRDIADRKRAEGALKEYSERLEEMVAKRTQELTRRTQQLEEQTLALAKAKELAETAREEAEYQKEKAEIANRAKSTFLATMSHELRTPLNGILGYAQILGHDHTLSEQQIQGLRIIQESGHHLLTLINDILDLSKIEAERMELYPTAVQFPQFLGEVADIVRMRAYQKGITFQYEADTAIPEGVLVDEKRLRQVLINLLDNAVKFTDAGEVCFTITAQEDRKTEDDRFPLQFSVRDTGSGIAAAQLTQIFRPFEQVGDVRLRATGTGLGLAICRKLVQLLGGDLQVKSTPGKGSLFWFDLSLPVVAVKTEKETAIEYVSGYEGERRTVLVVDDMVQSRLLLQRLLLALGFKVILADSGEQAITLAAAERPDLILMDMIMPELSGFETVSMMRCIPELKDVTIIAISASAFHADQEESKLVGCDDFLPKPLNTERLLAMLQQYLQLTWISAQVNTVAQQETAVIHSLIPPPPEEMEVLFDLAMRGDMRRLRRQALRIAHLDEKYEPFAQELITLAMDYDEQKILTLVKQYMPSC